jgi:hypothetical protein
VQLKTKFFLAMNRLKLPGMPLQFFSLAYVKAACFLAPVLTRAPIINVQAIPRASNISPIIRDERPQHFSFDDFRIVQIFFGPFILGTMIYNNYYIFASFKNPLFFHSIQT